MRHVQWPLRVYGDSGNFFFMDMLNSPQGKNNQTLRKIDTNPYPFKLFSRGLGLREKEGRAYGYYGYH